MRRATSLLFSAAGAALVLGGCADRAAEPTGPVSPTISVTVAPIDVPSMSDACYTLTVWNHEDPDHETAEVVWTQPELCASQYGANGGIRYTGICDATAGTNSIRLELNDVYRDGGGGTPNGTVVDSAAYVNPCPAAEEPEETEDNGCVQQVACVTNQDTLVEFNLTVMRQAELGFLDAVVRFSDIFCAAKLDCVDSDGGPLHYLYNPATQSDGPTAVLGFTCLSATGAPVEMYLDDIVVACGEWDEENGVFNADDEVMAIVSPSAGPGNLSEGSGISVPDTNPLFGAAVHSGQAMAGGRYWNVVLGLDLAILDEEECMVMTRGTASERRFQEVDGAFSAPASTRYPYIEWAVMLTTEDGFACGQHPLNGTGANAGVSTVYTEVQEALTFAHRLVAAPCPCWDRDTLFSEVEALTSSPVGAYLENLSGDYLLEGYSEAEDDDRSAELYLVPRDIASGNSAWDEELIARARSEESDSGECRYKDPADTQQGSWVEISMSEYLECEDDILTVLNAKRACPCWDPASLQTLIAAVGTLDEVYFDFDGEDEEFEMELDLRAPLAPGALRVRFIVDGDEEEAECELRVRIGHDDGENTWWETIIDLELMTTPAQTAQCAAELLAAADDPCQVNNGGCPVGDDCVYQGPGQHTCENGD